MTPAYCIFSQGVDHFKKIQYAPGITYGELFLENEYVSTATIIFQFCHAAEVTYMGKVLFVLTSCVLAGTAVSEFC